MALELLAQWLRCPNCFEPLSPTADLTIGCATGHRFDVNKRGYVTLVTTRNATSGDTLAMLNDRAALLGSGAYAPIVDALIGLLPEMEAPRVLDAGCGTGYYLARILEKRARSQGLALDRSPAAVRMATRAGSSIHGLVADTWEPLPIRDGVCDVILNVFAPRNASEFSRVLTDSGTMLVVVPRPEHLRELRVATDMLSIPAGKPAHVAEQLAGYFTQSGHASVTFTLPLVAGQAELLREMGPSAHHEKHEDASPPRAVSVAVDVLRFTRL